VTAAAITADGGELSRSFAIEVVADNDAPRLTGARSQSIDEDSGLTLVLASIDTPPNEAGEAYAVSDVVLVDPDGVVAGVIDVVIDGTQVLLVGELAANAHGVFDVEFTVSDDGVPARETAASFEVVVESVNDAPVLQTRHVTAVVGMTRLADLVVIDADGDDVSVVVPSGNTTAGTLLVQSDGAYAFVASDTAGTATVTIVLDDGTESVTPSIELTALETQRSCFHVRARDAATGEGAAGDGVYPLLDDNENTYDAWCDMATANGGWTLVMKADGNGGQWGFEAGRWTNSNLLAEDAATAPRLEVGPGDGADGESKLASYLTVAVDEILIGFAPTATGSTDFDFVQPLDLSTPDGPAATSLRALLLPETSIEVATPDVDAWLAVDATFSIQQGCTRRGVNIRPDDNNGSVDAIRLGVLGSDDDCQTSGSFVGVGAKSPGAVVGNRNQLVTNPRHAAVFVRSNDLMDLSPRASCAAFADAGFVVDGFFPVVADNAGIEAARTFCALAP
jgi:hypothetical protein